MLPSEASEDHSSARLTSATASLSVVGGRLRPGSALRDLRGQSSSDADDGALLGSCGVGLLGSQRPSLADYVTLPGVTDGATASGCRSCWLSSRGLAPCGLPVDSPPFVKW